MYCYPLLRNGQDFFLGDVNVEELKHRKGQAGQGSAGQGAAYRKDSLSEKQKPQCDLTDQGWLYGLGKSMLLRLKGGYFLFLVAGADC